MALEQNLPGINQNDLFVEYNNIVINLAQNLPVPASIATNDSNIFIYLEKKPNKAVHIANLSSNQIKFIWCFLL